MQGYGSQGDGLLLTYRQQQVHLSAIGLGMERFGIPNEAVGHAGTGGHDHDYLVTVIV